MIPSDLAVRFRCHEIRDNLLLKILEHSDDFLPERKTSVEHEGMTLKLTYPETYKNGVLSHTSCTLVAPKALVESMASFWEVYEFSSPNRA